MRLDRAWFCQNLTTLHVFTLGAAQQMFAVFDQPDQKATYQLNVTAPADWTVISTTRESAVQATSGDPASRRWTFPRTKKLSPYNFSMHAGPYKMWEDTSGPYPMRLFARQSVASQIKPAEWFKNTKQGLTFFDNYFGVPYQFDKYDQVLVPDFLYGAMENAGAITFAEARFLYKANMPAAQRAQMEATMKRNGVSMPKTNSDGNLVLSGCVTPEMAAKKEFPVFQKGQCKSKAVPASGGLDVSFSCTDPATSGKGKVRFIDDNHYVLDMVVENPAPGGGTQKANISTNGRWLSATCPAKQ